MLKIRRYRDQDKEMVWALHNEALEEVGAHAGNGPWDDDFQQIKQIYIDARGEFLVGEFGGRIVAIGALKKISDTCAEIKRMRVHPQFQRRGFGNEILNRLERRAMELGYSCLHLDTTVQQTAAQKLYVQHGFKEIGRGRLADMDIIYMKKTLTHQK